MLYIFWMIRYHVTRETGSICSPMDIFHIVTNILKHYSTSMAGANFLSSSLILYLSDDPNCISVYKKYFKLGSLIKARTGIVQAARVT